MPAQRTPEQTFPHRDGCPKGANRRDVSGEPVTTSLESYQAARPDGRPVTVTRCVDCGAQTVTDQKGAA